MTKFYLTAGAIIANKKECHDIAFTPKQIKWIKKALLLIDQSFDDGQIGNIVSKFSPSVTVSMTANDRGWLCALAVYAANYKFIHEKHKLKTSKVSVRILEKENAEHFYKIMVRKTLFG